ncbi:GNAT family N-acetyltransferase [Paradesertivirga mongoliensis]|uniref:GNAT family N-acetyltransferase n=1 Tax=Paradesertivirga mongoliensis TaxID=2100740 RepID=A0ABW4ZHL5_9SPHI|nr:GNAT family N-acetyltransferase [Pedobacter mongoliensis]
MIIRTAIKTDIPAINRLANTIWKNTYREILSASQIEFMLNDMYSLESLSEQFDQDVHFLLAEKEEQAVAFASYSLVESNPAVYKIHKLYILPQEQGKGTGKKLLNYIREEIIDRAGEIMELNVNRANPALEFYKKYGFSIVKEVDIPYHTFFLNDYIMRMPV